MDRHTRLSPQLIFGIGTSSVLLILIYNLVLPPQSWTFNNDYGMLRTYGVPGFNWWQSALSFIESMKSDGRFLPVFAFTLMPRYAFLPLVPEAFRVVQLIVLVCALVAFYQSMTLLKIKPEEKFLALFIATMSFVTKEWILLTAASEPLATMFFFMSLVLFLKEHKILSAAVFSLSFLSKESFFVLAPVFILLEWKRPSKHRWLMSALVMAEVLVFLMYMKSLPRKYTAGHFESLSILNSAKALILPPIKSFGPMMALFAFLKPDMFRKLEFWLGVIIVIPFSIFLVGWGSYDSWTYLHAIVPFGWAFIFVAIWQNVSRRNAALLISVCGVTYSTYTTINGSLNWWRFLEGGKQAASRGCDHFKENPSTTLFMNCDEGASQLSNYLYLSGKCIPEPKIKYFRDAEEVLNAPNPKFVIYANKYCPKSSMPPNPKFKEDFLSWTLFSY